MKKLFLVFSLAAISSITVFIACSEEDLNDCIKYKGIEVCKGEYENIYGTQTDLTWEEFKASATECIVCAGQEICKFDYEIITSDTTNTWEKAKITCEVTETITK